MSSSAMSGPMRSWTGQVRALLFVAMAVFLVTIGIGIVNGLDLYTFDRNQLLTHVHSGTLGWITLSLVAASTWRAGGIDRRLAWALAIIIPVYVLGFFLAIPWLRAVVGGVLLLVILWLVVWAWGVYRSRRSLPALAIALGFTTFTYGAIIGVLRQIQLAGGPAALPVTADIVGAHASAMVFSYLILVAMGLLEWRVLGTTGLPRGGLVQLGAPLHGRPRPLVHAPVPGRRRAPGSRRHRPSRQHRGRRDLRLPGRAGGPPGGLDGWSPAVRHGDGDYVVVAMAIFLYVIVQFINDPAIADDPTSIVGILTASDHAAFIGVVTNLVFGLLADLDRGSGVIAGPGHADRVLGNERRAGGVPRRAGR